MKRISTLLIFVLLLSACSTMVDQLLGRPTATPVKMPTNTPTTAPTLTPTVPSPTFTSSPTMIPQSVKSPTPLASPTMLILTQVGVIPMPPSTAVELAPQVKMTGFVSVAVSDAEFYKGTQCQPASTKFTANVADAAGTAFVVLFVRFKSKQTGTTSEWTSIGMSPSGIPGIYTHDLVASEMKAVKLFENAWVQYQLVATNAGSREVGRTDIFSERLTLLECVITPTPEPSITPTVLTP